MTVDNITVDKVYGWLNFFNEDQKGYLGNPVEKLITQVMEAVKNKNYPGAVYFIDIAIKVGDSMGSSLEKAETHFKCGYAYYQMENYLKAIIEYRHAISYYNIVHPHNLAITHWLLGCAHWKTMNLSKAIVVWEKSCNKFQKLEAMSAEQKEDEQAEWYGEICMVMCDDLAKAIEAGRWPYQ